MIPIVDTHIWIWWLTGQKELDSKRRKKLDKWAADGQPPFLSAISLWEAQMLASKNRLKLKMDLKSWLIQASDPEVARIVPLDTSVVLAVNTLPEDFHGDPADRIIVASAMATKRPLLTDDKWIQKCGLVEILK
jgi:PIN domain nuclease of toxin-antitoxin system